MTKRALVFGLGLMAACGGGEPPAVGPAPITPGAAGVVALPDVSPEPTIEPVLFELFVMSQCPYAAQAVHEAAGLVEALGPNLDLRMEFIGDVTKTGLTSMHGPKEVQGDLLEVCAMKHTPRWFDFVRCLDEDYNKIDARWQACATKLDLPLGPIGDCAGSREGARLLATSFERSKARGARGSPTFYISGAKYEGGRRTHQLMRAVCNAFPGDKPDACKNVAEPPLVDVVMLGDRRCEQCNVGRFEGNLRSRIANPRFTVLDYGDAEGRALFDQIGPVKLPAAVFDRSLDTDKDVPEALLRSLVTVGDRRVLAMGSKWRPDCADSCQNKGCGDTLQCRAEKSMQLEVFVMSHCPFAAKGMAALQSVLDTLETRGNKLDLSIHYIGDRVDSGFKSMHGPAEVEEDLRQVCAIEHYKKKRAYLDYIWCRNLDYKHGDWRACTGKATGVSADVLAKCAEGEEGKRLLGASFAFSSDLGLGASPTWVVNGRHEAAGVTAEKIKTAICAHNKLPGCAVTLSSESPTVADAWPRAKKAPQPAPAPRPAPAPVPPPPAVAPPPQPGCSEDTAASTCGG